MRGLRAQPFTLAAVQQMHTPSPWVWLLGPRGGGCPKGLVDNLLMQLVALGSSKIEFSETYVFDIVAMQNDHATYEMPVLGGIYVFFTLFGYLVQGGGGRGGVPRDWCTTCSCCLSPREAQEWKVSKLVFFDIVTTQNDHPTYVKLYKACFMQYLCIIHLIWVLGVGRGGGVSQGIATQPVDAVFHPGQLKMEVSEIYFLDIVTTQNDHPTYGKHVIGSIHVFFTLGIGCGAGGAMGGGSQKIGTQPAYATTCHPGQLKNGTFRTYIVHIVTAQNDHLTYVKHVSGSTCVFFTLFGDSVRAGRGAEGLLRDRYTTC